MNFKIFIAGIWKKNPLFILGMGICPALAITTSISNALWMMLATTFVLIFSNMIVSLIKRYVPTHIRIPVNITVIATFVIVVELSLKAYQPAVYTALGIFIPLIVVNCIILARAEEFASKNALLPSFFDGLGMGIGFGISLVVIAFFRETLGANKLLGYTLIEGFQPVGIMAISPGAFITMGLILWGINKYNSTRTRK